MSYDVVPMTEEGIPTPSIITRGANEISGIDTMIIDSGFVQDPAIPFIKTGLGAARDGSKEKALPGYESALAYGSYLGALIDNK